MTIRTQDDYRLIRPTVSDLFTGLGFEDAADDGTCRYCNGAGVVLSHIDTGSGNAVDKPCPRCSGTGETCGYLA